MITKVYKDYYEEYKKDYDKDWHYAKDKLLNKLYGFDDRGEFTIEIANDLQEKEQEIERLNNIIDKINKLFDADAHCESIHYAIGVLLNKEYYDIENVWDEELLKILKGE